MEKDVSAELTPRFGSSPAEFNEEQTRAWETTNCLILALHQILFRLGWLFKTETVIIPTLVDYVAGAGWVRGWLPTLSRLGQSLPPVYFSWRLGEKTQLKQHLAISVGSMALLFALAAIVWVATPETKPAWMCPVILGVYLLFFVANGFYQVLFGSLQGKLIRPNRRGQLLQLSTFLGTIPSVILAWLLFPTWLANPARGFAYIFAAAAVGFASSALVALAVWEPQYRYNGDAPPMLRCLGPWYATSDRQLRRLLLICFLVSTAWMLTPHYQAFGRARFEASAGHLTTWVIVQSIAVGVFSLVVGPLADRRGNRLAMRVVIFGAAISPLAALSITALPAAEAARWYWLVYLPLGLAPLISRVILNYALELSPPPYYPIYQSITNLGLAFPLAFSPLVGWIIDLTSFELVFALAAGCILCAGLLTFFLAEPRFRLTHPVVIPPPPQHIE